MSCCGGSYGCGTDCKCGNGCSGCAMYPEETAVAFATGGDHKGSSGGGMMEMAGESGGCDCSTCKCGTSCGCSCCSCT